MKGSASANGKIEAFGYGLMDLVLLSKKAGRTRLSDSSARYKRMRKSVEKLRYELFKEYVDAVRREE